MTRASRGLSAAERRERRAQVEDPAVVMEAAGAFLAVRPRSVAATSRRLRQLGYRQSLVDQVVERLVEMGYLDDEAFTQAWIESRDRARPRGQGALRRELSLKGVPPETVASALEERLAAAPAGEGPDMAAARQLLGRRRASLEREPDARKRRQKAYALLARHGFDPEVCREASAVFGDSAAEPEC